MEVYSLEDQEAILPIMKEAEDSFYDEEDVCITWWWSGLTDLNDDGELRQFLVSIPPRPSCQASGSGRREGEPTSPTGMTPQCLTMRTITACSYSPLLVMVNSKH